MEILPFYRNLIEFFQIFRENLDSNLGKFENLHLLGVPGEEPPEANEFINNLLEKSLETPIFLEICINSE